MLLSLVLKAVVVFATLATEANSAMSKTVLGGIGASCQATCQGMSMFCDPYIRTNNSVAIFEQLGVKCNVTAEGDPTKTTWWAQDQPSFCSSESDPNYGDCLGYKNVPGMVECAGSYKTTQRVCVCTSVKPGPPPPLPPNASECWYIPGGTKECWDNVSATARTFGTGLSGGMFSVYEKTIFAHQIATGHTGMMNHFWSTCNAECEGALIVRYYIDGETSPSIEFEPGMAAGVGFDDTAAPWGTKWAGHGAHSAWFNNFKIPFGSSIRVTIQSTDGQNHGGFYMIVRGALDVPLIIGEATLPPTARLQLQKFNGPMNPLDVLDVVSVPVGHEGQIFLTALAVQNDGVGGLNFLEGCYHMYDPPTAPFPGVLLSTGTEDFFDSGWYFNAGEFQYPVSGFTHIKQQKNLTEWSAYRYHEMDPLRFGDGVKMTWRCGDLAGPAPNGGGKCFTQTGGHPVGSPTCENVLSYGWVYVWPASR